MLWIEGCAALKVYVYYELDLLKIGGFGLQVQYVEGVKGSIVLNSGFLVIILVCMCLGRCILKWKVMEGC